MHPRVTKAIVLLGVVVFVVLACYLAAQWSARAPLTARVLDLTVEENDASTVKVEIKNSSPFPIKVGDRFILDAWNRAPVVSGNAPYLSNPVDPAEEIVLLRPGQTIERILMWDYPLGPAEGDLRYCWEPTTAATLRRTVRYLEERWTGVVPLAPGSELRHLRLGQVGPLTIPPPKEASAASSRPLAR